MYEDAIDAGDDEKPSPARAKPFYTSIRLDRPAWCMGCGSFLGSPTWVVIQHCVFCKCCATRDREQCVGILPLLDTPYWYGIVQNYVGLYFLCPQDHHYRGHSIWRIWQAKAAEERRDWETAAWFLQGSKIDEGPEHVHNTPLTVVPGTAYYEAIRKQARLTQSIPPSPSVNPASQPIATSRISDPSESALPFGSPGTTHLTVGDKQSLLDDERKAFERVGQQYANDH